MTADTRTNAVTTTTTARPSTYHVRCARRDVTYELGVDRVLSAHRTSEGVVTYLRCPCGDVVLHRPRAAAGGPRTPVAAPPTGPTLREYLTTLSALAEGPPAGPGVAELMHETVSVLAKAATDQGVEMRLPDVTDSHAAHLRVLARLAQRTAGREVPVRPPFACRLDELVPELARAVAVTARQTPRRGRPVT